MRSGIIGVPTDSSSLGIESVDEMHKTRKEYGLELRKVIDLQEVQTLGGETLWVEGAALMDDVEEVDKYDVDDGTIYTREGKRRIPKYANFLAVPEQESHRGFVVISSSDAEFVFDLIGRQNHVTIGRAQLSLGAFLRDHSDFTAASGGTPVTGTNKADTVLAYGNDVLNDDNVGEVLNAAADTDQINPLAGKYDYNSHICHVNMADSGYVQVYNPAFETGEFIDWVRHDVLPYVDQNATKEKVDRKEAQKDRSEKADDDPDQSSLDDLRTVEVTDGGSDDA